MINIFSLILGLAIAACFGWFLMGLFRISLPFLERISISYGLGLAVITFVMFSLNVIGVPFSAGSALFVPVLSIAYMVFKGKKRIKSFLGGREGIKNLLTPFRKNLSLPEKIVLIGIVILVATALARALYWPIFYWDAITTFDARAKFFLHDGLMAETIKNVGERFHPYPPFTSLAHLYFYLLGANNPTVLYVFLYIAILITMFFSLRDRLSPLWNLSLCFLLAAAPLMLEHAAAPYTNLSYTFFLGMGTIYLVRFLEKKEISLFWVGTLLFNFSVWVRPNTEWFFLVSLIILIIFALLRKNLFWLPIVFLFNFLVIWLPWLLFLKFGAQYNFSNESWLVGISFQRINNILLATMEGKVDWHNFLNMIGVLLSMFDKSLKNILYLFLLALFLGFFGHFIKPKAATLVLIFMASYFLVLFIGAYGLLIIWSDWVDYFTNSANRLVMVILPLFVYFIGLTLADKKEK